MKLWWSRKHRAASNDAPQPSSSDPLCKLQDFGDLDGQKKCCGCKRIRNLFEARKLRDALPNRPVVFHASYASLDHCAQHCVTCRVFRQALLLEDVTADHATMLAKSSGVVSAQLEAAREGYAVNIRVQDHRENVVAKAVVHCAPQSERLPINLAGDPADESIYRQARDWLYECKLHHDCGNLAYSDRRPTRLLRILSETTVQLVDSKRTGSAAGSEPPRYTALSYCWGYAPTIPTGAAGELSVAEAEVVEQAKTLTANLRSRYEPFDIAFLPSAVRDAITITRRLSDPSNKLALEHIWVDTLCIVQDDDQDKAVEIQHMQEVYGNAAVTICATATAKATQPLLQRRLAWSKPVTRCRIGSIWMTVDPTPLADLRARSPLARRAWTLQEEHLSPRLLFWSGQQLSWACGHGEYIEQTSTAFFSASPPPLLTPLVRKFLVACRDPTERELSLVWHALVESYTARGLSNPEDRLNALAGLSTRYLAACSGDNEYMAGLWRTTFAQDLLWRVAQPARAVSASSIAATLPSWSWASLPIALAVCMLNKFEMQSEMELLRYRPDDLMQEQFEREPAEAVSQGALVRRVRVRGPLRRLWGTGSRLLAWDAVCAGVGSVGRNRFDFSTNPGQDVHAVDCRTAQLVAYEARKREVVGWLDYAEAADDIAGGRMLDVWCLAVSQQHMLLLGFHNQTGAYRRIGVALNCRSDFFKNADWVELYLE